MRWRSTEVGRPVCFFFSSRRRHTRCLSDWSSDVCSSDLLAFADYREVSSDLHYRGTGGGVAASFTFKKLGVEGSITALTYKPVTGSTATAEFKATQLDVRVRYYITGPVSAEVGFVNRKAKPEFEAH